MNTGLVITRKDGNKIKREELEIIYSVIQKYVSVIYAAILYGDTYSVYFRKDYNLKKNTQKNIGSELKKRGYNVEF